MSRLQNVTVTLDERVAHWAKIEAAKKNTSVSRMLGDLLANEMNRARTFKAAMRQHLARLPKRISDGRPYPSRDELHERSGLR